MGFYGFIRLSVYDMDDIVFVVVFYCFVLNREGEFRGFVMDGQCCVFFYYNWFLDIVFLYYLFRSKMMFCFYVYQVVVFCDCVLV